MRGSQPWALQLVPAVLGVDPQQGSAHLDHINKGCTSHLDPVPGSDSLPNGITPHPDHAPLQLRGTPALTWLHGSANTCSPGS